MAAESSVYLSGDSLQEIYELQKGGFLDDDVDFNKELHAATSTEEIDGKNKVFKCTMCGKNCISSWGLKRHIALKHVQEKEKKEHKKVLIAIDEFINIMNKCADSCNEDLCFPDDTRQTFSSFDFTPGNAVELWVVLKPVVEKFHGNAENYYSWFIAIKFTTKKVWWWYYPNKYFITRSWQSYFNAFVSKESSL